MGMGIIGVIDKGLDLSIKTFWKNSFLCNTISLGTVGELKPLDSNTCR